MFRIIMALFIIVTVLMMWYAFRRQSFLSFFSPILSLLGVSNSSHNRNQRTIKGPDDDADFLWNIEKEQFKKRRAEERKKKDPSSERSDEEKPEEKPDDTGSSTD